MDPNITFPLEKYQGEDIHMAMMDCKQISILEKLIHQFNNDLDIHVLPGQYSTDLSLKTSSKGKGIHYLCDYLHIDQKDTIAFCDGPNDIEMFQTVQTSFAMNNAVQKLKDIATHITLSVEDERIYEVLINHQRIQPL